MSTFNRERAAKALSDAALMGDRAAAQKYDVTQRSIENWRSRLDDDPIFSALFQELRQEKNKQWADDLPAALTSCIDFLKRAGQEASPADAAAITAVATAAETLADIALTQRMVDERLRAARSQDSQA